VDINASSESSLDAATEIITLVTDILTPIDGVDVSPDDDLKIVQLVRNVTTGHSLGLGFLGYRSRNQNIPEDQLEALWDNTPEAEGGLAELEALVVRHQTPALKSGNCSDTIPTNSEPNADVQSKAICSQNGGCEGIAVTRQIPGEEQVKAADHTDSPAPIAQVDEIVARLASLRSSERLRQMQSSAKVLGINIGELEKKVDALLALQGSADELSFGAVEPWPNPIDPAAVLDEITDTILRYVVLSPEQAWAGALWIVMTWVIDYIEVAPIALIDAPERECGKSRQIEVFGLLVARPLQAANSSVSFIFRAIEAWQITLLIDEGDTFLRDNEELKGIINVGHTRANAFVGRSVASGNDFAPKMFSVWSAKAIAGIRMDKHLPESTISRCIRLMLRRKTKTEKVERLRRADHIKFKSLIAKLARFAEDYGQKVQQARPVMPDQLSDRAADNWEPLFAIAACAGEVWLMRVEQAALALSAKN
jgi:putative DNA primase/helicase